MPILIVGITVILLLEFALSDSDIMNPVFISCAVFLMSIFSAFYNVQIWKVDMSSTTVALILCSMGFMSLCSVIVTRLSARQIAPRQMMMRPIRIENYKLVLILLLGVAAAYLYLHDIMRIARAGGYISGGGLTAMLKAYRQSHFDSSAMENSVSRATSYATDIYKVMAHLVTYVAINNLLVARTKKERLKVIPLFSVTLLYLATSILGAARFRILQMFAYIVIVFFMLYKKKNGWNKKFSIKTIFTIILAVFLVLALFVGLRSVIGRESETDPLYYVTSYMGGSVQLLDMFIKRPLPPSDIFGKESFYMIYSFLGRKMNIVEWQYTFVKEFRVSNGVNVGNVYSALRCFYYDFGFAGCVLCSGIVGVIYTLIYNGIGRRKLDPNIDLGIVAYGFIFYAIALYSINYYFDFVSPSYLKIIVFFIIGRWFLVKFRFRSAPTAESVRKYG